MSISINTNNTALSAIGVLRANERQANEISERIITGKRVNSAKDNASSFSMANHMRVDIATMNTVATSINRGLSVTEVALNSAQLISDILMELKEKAVLFAEASDDGTKTAIINDFNSKIEQINIMVENASFNGQNLLKPGSIESNMISENNVPFSDGKVLIGDWNSDGINDIATDSATGFSRSISDKDGNLSNFQGGSSSAKLSDIGDMNNDGDVDFLYAQPDFIIMNESDGSGAVASNSFFAVSPNGQTEGLARLGDFNQDNNLDVVRRASGSSVEVFTSDGDYNFSGPSTTNMTNITNITDIKTSDLDNNGSHDLVVSGTGGGHAYIETYTNNGNGSFSLSSSQQFSLASDIGNIELNDFNEDGSTDIASLSTTSGVKSLNVMTGNADGTFSSPPTVIGSFSTAPTFTSGDVNNDGHEDLVILDGKTSGNLADDSLAIYEGKGDGSFTIGTSISASSITENMKSIKVGDVTGDNVNDLIWSDANTPDSPNNTFVLKQKAENFSVQLSSGGETLKIALEGMDTSSLGLFKLSLKSSSKSLNEAITSAIDKVNLQMTRLGSAVKRLEGALIMNTLVQDKLEEGVGNLVDADMPKEAAKQQALAVKQQLGVKSFNLTTQSPFQILTLFGIGR